MYFFFILLCQIIVKIWENINRETKCKIRVTNCGHKFKHTDKRHEYENGKFNVDSDNLGSRFFSTNFCFILCNLLFCTFCQTTQYHSLLHSPFFFFLYKSSITPSFKITKTTKTSKTKI